MGGPDPNMKGDINVASYHVGENGIGKTFSESNEHFERDYMTPFTDFLVKAYPQSVRDSRSLAGQSDVVKAGSSKLETEESPGFKGVALGATELSVDVSPPIVTSVPAPLVITPTPALALPLPSVTRVLHPPTVTPTPASSVFIPVPAPAPALPLLTVTPVLHTPIVTYETHLPVIAPETHLPVITPTPLQPEAISFPNANITSPVLDEENGGMAMGLEGMSYLDAFLASYDDRGNTPGPDNFSLTTRPLDDYNWDKTSEFFSQYGNTSNPQYLPNTSNDQSSLPFLATAPSSGLASTHEPQAASTIPSVPTPPTTIPSPAIIPSPSTIPSPSQIPLLSSIPPTPVPVVAPSDPPLASTDASPLPLGSSNSAVPRSRSGRQITASKRADEMNKIGSDGAVFSHSSGNKENIPPSASVPLPWRGMAEAHLRSAELGEKWITSVTTWGLFEDAMSSNSKVGLTAKSRPEEWQKWISKSQNGVRAYDTTPLIADPLEFGYAVMGWWKHMQPEFRQTSDVLPPSVYQPSLPSPGGTDTWASLRKGGPNGMVTMLTLLAWWGQALSRRSQYQEDSQPFWERTVDDVRECLAVMLAKPAVPKRKRAAPSGSSKRAKTTIS
ncbi:hypothetical protein DXG01_008906 [Tephrocybe rancida]|nr:hypothetical protein DXG01_008906 [Tephrocybe rancida]